MRYCIESLVQRIALRVDSDLNESQIQQPIVELETNMAYICTLIPNAVTVVGGTEKVVSLVPVDVRLRYKHHLKIVMHKPSCLRDGVPMSLGNHC